MVIGRARERAPRKAGRLAAGITGRLQASPVPRYGTVTNNAERNGVRYPFILNAGHFTRRIKTHFWKISARTGKRYKATKTINVQGPEFHFRSTGRKGWRTHYWFFGALYDKRNQINKLLTRAAREIELGWLR